MTAPPGWYPDPAGTPNRLRYWDGARWTDGPGPGSRPAAPAGRRGRLLMIVGAVAAVLVLIIAGILVINSGIGGALGVAGPGAGSPTGTDCPPADAGPASTRPSVGADGRVRSGPLSYPALERPWSAPVPEDRVPFGRDLVIQWVRADTNTRDGHLWASAVVIGELNSGDGFLGPEQAATLMAQCITGTLYGDHRVDTTIKISKPTTVDGHAGWLLEARLAYDIAGLRTKGETMIIVIVDAGTSTGLFYAGLPDSGPQYVAPARAALRDLEVAS